MNRLHSVLFAAFYFNIGFATAQCPTLGQNATFTSADCQPGSNPCALCPGDTYTLNATGTNLQAGDCINWYISDMPNFNPYNGQGTLLGCSELTSPPPDPCNPNPIFLGILVNACGQEENNEFFGLWSGGGFYVSDLDVSYNDPGNNGCGWQTPSGAVESAVEDDCPGAVFAGPGDAVPANVPVIVFTSSAADFNYNFSALCSTYGTVYILQSACAPAGEVFPNSGSGSVSTTVSIGCWSEDITYNLAQLPGGNGAFVSELPFLGTIYGQAGCGWPSFPGLPGTDPIVNVTPLEVEVTADQCNNGPFYIVGIYEPLPTNCPQVFTNYLSYDVLCPMPNLGTTDLCASVSNFNLVQIQDPGVPNGTWSGDGVTGSTFNASGLSGPVSLTFTPTSPCGTPATTVINVFEAATATLDPVAPVCPGGTTNLMIHFTGTAPWSFNLTGNGLPLGSFTTFDNPAIIPISPTGTTTYVIQNLKDDAGCMGPNVSIQVAVSNNNPSAVLSLLSNDSLCAGSAAQLSVNFSGGVPPYDFVYAVNGLPQPVLDVTQDPYNFPVTIINNSVISLVSLADNNGCNGTVSGTVNLTVLPSPTAMIVSDTVQICAGSTDSLRIKFTGTAPFRFIFRINGVNQPIDTAFTNMIVLPIQPVGDTVVYTLFSVVDSICTGTVSGIYRVISQPGPTATLIGMDTICAGQSSSITIDFTGTGPFLVNYTANNIPQLPILTSVDPFVLTVTPSTTTTYQLTSVQSNGCTGTVSGSAVVAIAPPLSGTVSGGGQICQGGSGTTVTFSFTGFGPFTFVYSANNVPQPPITTAQSTYTLQVNPSIGTAYRLVSVTDAAGCAGTFSGVAQVFVFVPASAEMSGDATFCDSAMTSITIDFNGSGPFTIEYTINNIAQPPVFTSEDPFFIPVNVSTTTTYVLTNVESPGCTGIPSGSATVTVNYPPSYANLDLNCNPAQNNYTVSFTVVGGTPPYTLVSGAGVFTGDQFTSTPIPQSNGYNIVFHDANDCEDIVVSGPNTCNCITEAGSMNLTPLTACENEVVNAPYQGGAVNDGNDVLLFVLHSNPALPLGTIYAWNTTSTFGFQPGMVLGNTYYISAISGNAGQPGQVDLADPCLSVSQGTPVVFYGQPTADIGISSHEICLGDSVQLDIVLTGTPPFTLVPAFDGVPQSPITGISSGTYTYIFYPANGITVTLSSVSDLHCSTGATAGQVSVTILPPPAFGPETITCDYLSSTYTVSFAVTGEPPYNLSNMLATFNGTVFTSLPIPFGTPYFTLLTDNNNCGQDTLAGLGNCSCLSDAGTMSPTLVSACPTSTLTVPDTMNVVLEPGDIVMYILHTNPGLPLGTILAWSNTPSFTFGNGMQSGVTYYVSAIVGNPDGLGMVDLNDPCLSVATGTPVQWRPSPTATLTTGTFNVCPGVGQPLLVTFTGTPNYTLTYTSNGTPFTVFPTQNLFSINAQLQQTAVFQLVSVTDALGCIGTVSGQATVTVHPTPQVANIVFTCNQNTQTYILEFDVTVGDLSTAVVNNLSGTYDPLTGHFISDPIPADQSYSFTVQDSWLCGSTTVTDSVQCQCLSDAGNMASGNLLLCADQLATTSAATGFVLDPGDVLVYLLVDATTPANWTVLATNNTPSFSFNPATMAYGATYFIVAAAGNSTPGGINFNDPCFSSAIGPEVIWRAPVTATLAGANTICIGATATIPVVLGGEGPYSFTYSSGSGNQAVSNVTQNPYLLNVSPGVNSIYTITGVSGAGACAGNGSGNFTVQVNQLPQAINVLESCDFNTETYTLSFDINNGSTPNGNYTVIGIQGTINDTTFTSVPLPGNQPYQVVISDANGCSTSLSGQPNCLCASSAGTLGGIQNTCLPNGIVSAQSNGDSNLDSDDVLRYFLCTDPAALPAGILAESGQAQFGFIPGSMAAGVTYYLVVGVGNAQANGNLDFNDPCVSLSSGFPVVFNAAPTALISDTLSVCAGSGAQLPVNFTGQAPFAFEYSINGVSQGIQTAGSGTISLGSNNVLQDLIFTLLSVSDANCPGTVVGQGLIEAIPVPSAALAGAATICPGDQAVLTLTLSGADSFNVLILGGLQPIDLQGVISGTTVNVAPTTTSNYQLANFQAIGNSCPPVIGPGVTINVDFVDANASISDYNGYNITCPNDTDGSITLSPTAGMSPFVASWSNGATGLNLTNLGPGNYTVTLNDQLGCTWIDSFLLVAPEELSIQTEITAPVCFGQNNGFITINGISGGPGPFQILLDMTVIGSADQFPYVIPRLESGAFVLSVEDLNGCLSDTSLTVPSPEQLSVNLGPDTTISFGDSLYLVPIINSPELDTFIWLPSTYLQTPDMLNNHLRPLSSIEYELYIRDMLGCEASDRVVISVRKDRRVFIPNVINPQSPNLNDVVSVWAAAEVAKVRYMRIYDRWGEMVFEQDNFLPNDPQFGWRGQFRGSYVDPAVFVYVVEVEYIDGETEVFSGDITVVR